MPGEADDSPDEWEIVINEYGVDYIYDYANNLGMTFEEALDALMFGGEDMPDFDEPEDGWEY